MQWRAFWTILGYPRQSSGVGKEKVKAHDAGSRWARTRLNVECVMVEFSPIGLDHNWGGNLGVAVVHDHDA